MDAVIVEAKANQERVDAQEPLEIGDDRDRAAGPDQQRFGAPFLRQSRTRGGERWRPPVKRDRGCPGMAGELDLAVGRQARARKSTERLANLHRLLALDQ